MPPTTEVTEVRDGEPRSVRDLPAREAQAGPPPEDVVLELVDVRIESDRSIATQVRPGAATTIPTRAKLLPKFPTGWEQVHEGNPRAFLIVAEGVAAAIEDGDLIASPTGGTPTAVRVVKRFGHRAPGPAKEVPEGMVALVTTHATDRVSRAQEMADSAHDLERSKRRGQRWQNEVNAVRREREERFTRIGEAFAGAVRRAGIGDEEFGERLRWYEFDVSDADPKAEQLDTLDEAAWDRALGSALAGIEHHR
jgi:hypothetical protein